jgi:CoA:oxalate CoA-transferase
LRCRAYGDDSRAFGPFVRGKSLYFSALNYDQESIALNLHEAADREIFQRLLSHAEVLVENFRFGTMEKLGCSWELLHVRYPNLICAVVSGFGQTGPDSHRAAYDVVVQGRGGIMSITGQPDTPPTRVGVSIGDLAAALYLAIDILSVLRKRNHGGGAVKVDVAMLDCQVALLETALTANCCTGRGHSPATRHPRIAPFQVYATRDNYLVLAAGNDRLFALMARAWTVRTCLRTRITRRTARVGRTSSAWRRT